MSAFYLRKARLLLKKSGRVVHIINPGDETDDQIQIEFAISKSLSSTANTANIQVWNLSQSTRNAMGKEFDGIELEAGYIPPDGGSTVGTIFAGNLRDVEHRMEGTETITTIQCGDGDAAIRSATIAKTYPAGTKVGTVVDDLYAQFKKQGIARGEVKGLDDLPAFKRPYSMCGDCAREMDRIGRSNKLHWSMQNETFEVIPGDGFLGGIALITPTTGLIGTPSLTDNGIRAECMLNPQIRPGRRVQIESATLEMNAEGGVYRVGSCDFTGNNRSGEFKTGIHAESINGGKVDEGRTPATVPIPTPRPE